MILWKHDSNTCNQEKDIYFITKVIKRIWNLKLQEDTKDIDKKFEKAETKVFDIKILRKVINTKKDYIR